ncbi:helix-turn-helix transcriptional regulator [Paenibacillus sedimenti]|uniref:Response regulator transcription factor n=1 Tax=Paenibacillus sedimenti TaxID=2770274 RepID=A0A926QJ59_9BACL|nr:LuxR C-terminal-related transcriptional regulator [Paenibacillus sedimenti]MBD0380052.1 response regulator transcription factor [Paenibacillus sedimenti]
MLPSQVLPAFQGVFPSTIVTSSLNGIPNITNLSRVWHLDHEHVAIANQLLLKTASNLYVNPLALIKIVNPYDLQHWELTVSYIRSNVEDPLVESMRDDIRTVSWMAGIPNSDNVRSAMIFNVLSVRKCLEETQHLTVVPELFVRQVIERSKLEWAKSTDPFHTVLSARERQVSQYVAKGHTNAEIAKALFVSPRTVTTHMERIFQKLNLTSRSALTRYVVEKGLLTDNDSGTP